MLDLDVGYACRSHPDTHVCGDGWSLFCQGHLRRILFADGIGHGPHALAIVTLLQDCFQQQNESPGGPQDLTSALLELHQKLERRDHDVQAAVALIDLQLHDAEVCSLIVGNVRAICIQGDACIRFPSCDGMVGGRIPANLRPYRLDLQQGGLILIHSDGLSRQRSLDWLKQQTASPVIRLVSAQRIADTLLNQYAKSSDDASCAVLKVGALC